MTASSVSELARLTEVLDAGFSAFSGMKLAFLWLIQWASPLKAIATLKALCTVMESQPQSKREGG